MTEENGYQSGLQGCSPGIGAAINCDLPLVNVVDTWSKIDGAGLHRSRDAGTGAITPYHDRKSRATRTIQAGEVSWYIICSTMYEFIRLLNSTFATPTSASKELYIDYGENYFSTRQRTYGLMPLHKDYKEANEFIQRFWGASTQSLARNYIERKAKRNYRRLVACHYQLGLRNENA